MYFLNFPLKLKIKISFFFKTFQKNKTILHNQMGPKYLFFGLYTNLLVILFHIFSNMLHIVLFEIRKT